MRFLITVRLGLLQNVCSSYTNGEPTYPACNSSTREPRDISDRRYYSLFSRRAVRRDLYNTTTGPVRGNTEGLSPKEGTVRSKTVSTRLEPADRRRTYKGRPQGHTNRLINLD
jgi:hypothetical protein